jgi:CheY-like chemotaxis protein
MGGEIGVDSLPGQGCTFWLRLPAVLAPGAEVADVADVAEPAARAAAAAPAAISASPSSPALPARVLYIEDNPVNLVLMEAMLARMPELSARCVMSPVEGLALAAAEPPDLVLLDLQMPVMDGFEVLRRLRAQPALRHIPVYAVSANALQLDIEAALRAGFDGYLTKPIELDHLMSTVRGALQRSRCR